MAAITPTSLSMNTAQIVTQGTGTAIVHANTDTILYPRHGKLLLMIDSDHASTVITISAGELIAKGKGSLELAVGDTVMHLVILDSDRFKNDDGQLTLDYAADSAGFIQAYYLPQEC